MDFMLRSLLFHDHIICFTNVSGNENDPEGGKNTFSMLITFKWKNILKAKKASGFLEVAPLVANSCNLGPSSVLKRNDKC